MERKLASIRVVNEIREHPNADALEIAVVDGWTTVVKKGEFKTGDTVVFFEVDSVLPVKPEFEFLRKCCYVKKDWIEGFRLKTIRLRGQLSQGLVLPVKEVIQDGVNGEEYPFIFGCDVTELLGVQKWDPPVPASIAGQAKGTFPSFLRKSDQERCISKGTKVLTDDGELLIEDIVDGKLDVNVASYNHNTNKVEFKPVIDWSVMTRKNIWIKIALKSGKTIICTKNHKIWCDDILAYREAAQVQVGQKFIIKTDK